MCVWARQRSFLLKTAHSSHCFDEFDMHGALTYLTSREEYAVEATLYILPAIVIAKQDGTRN